MPLILPGNVASAVPTGYDVANSCLFNEAVMHVTPGSEGDTQKMTLSMWVKRSELGVEQQMWHTQNGSNQATTLVFGSNDKLYFIADDSNKLITTRVFRDPSAWYHIVLAIDTTNGTAGNRARLYVNGVEETVFDTDSAPSEDQALQWTKTTSHRIGSQADTANNAFNGYLAEVVWIDGTQYAASDFGEFDEDSPTIWKPKKVSTLTFGTNGFYLDFEASANLGNNAATGAADLTEVGIVAADQATDTPTNNFCTWNPLVTYYSDTVFSQGNLTQTSVTGEGGIAFEVGTFGLTAGKWYWEAKMTTFATSGGHIRIGITDAIPISDPNYFAYNANSAYSSGQFAFYSANGNIYHGADGDGGNDAYGNAWNQANSGQGVIISVAMDLDNNKLYFAKDGTWEASGDPAAGSNGFTITAATSTSGGQYFPAMGQQDDKVQVTETNFGGCPSFALSSAAADENGYGAFEYAPPSGFLALCTKNLGSDGG